MMLTFDIGEVKDRMAAFVRNRYHLERYRYYLTRGREVPPWSKAAVVRWEGGTDDQGLVHEPVWPRVVHFAARNRVSPALLAQAAFMHSRGVQPPSPTLLLTDKTLASARALQQQEAQRLFLELNFYRNQAHKYFVSFTVRGEDPREAWRSVVSSDPPALSPLFRYCLARKALFDDLAEMYADEALEEYLWSSDAYDALWPDWIPPDLQEAAAAVRSQLAVECYGGS